MVSSEFYFTIRECLDIIYLDVRYCVCIKYTCAYGHVLIWSRVFFILIKSVISYPAFFVVIKVTNINNTPIPSDQHKQPRNLLGFYNSSATFFLFRTASDVVVPKNELFKISHSLKRASKNACVWQPAWLQRL